MKLSCVIQGCIHDKFHFIIGGVRESERERERINQALLSLIAVLFVEHFIIILQVKYIGQFSNLHYFQLKQ